MRSFITCPVHQILLRAFKSRRMSWKGHVAWMGEMGNAYRILVGKSERRDHSVDPCVDGDLILEWILEK
jgi:hypothetical protein